MLHLAKWSARRADGADVWARRYHPSRCRNQLPGIPTISRAAAELISRKGLTRADVLNGLTRASDAAAFHVDLDGLAQQRPGGACVIFNPLAVDVALLQVWRRDFWYTETVGGEAILSMLDQTLPETICDALNGSCTPLDDIMRIEKRDDAFVLAGDPRILAVRTHMAGKHKSLTFRLGIEQACDNWNVD